MRRLLLLSLLLAGPAFAADVVFPTGSRIGLKPSESMVPARGLSGFVDPKTGASIVLLEMPPEAFPNISAGFTDEALKAQGFALRSRDELTLGAAKGLLVSGDQGEAGGRMIPKTVLLASDPSLTALVIGQLPPGAPAESEAELRNVMKTVSLRAPLTMGEQLNALPFSLGDLGGFRPIRVMAGNSVLLTEGPKDSVQGAEQPVLIVAQSFAPSPSADQRDPVARAALAGNTVLKDIVFERSGSFRQAGSEWHEIVARAKDAPSGQDVVVTQTMRFEPGGYIRAVGIMRADQRDDVLPRFRRIADGMAPR